MLLLAMMCGLTFILGVLRGASRPFWFDEIATTHIAAAPTWQQMVLQSRTVDLHPPLEPTLVRLSFGLFAPHEFAGRLPSVVAFTLTVGSLFLFLRRRMGALYAAFGALLPLANADVAFYATEARPYALLLAGVSVGVLAYDTLLREEHLTASRVVLSLCMLALLQVHLFGTFAAASFIAAEAVRSFRRRQVDWRTWAALLVPWLSCVDYIPILHSQGGGPAGPPIVYDGKDRTSLLKGFTFYHKFLYLSLAPLTKVIALTLLVVPFFPTRKFLQFVSLAPEMLVLLAILLAAPVLVTLLLHVHAPNSGFFPRYGITAACPAFLLFTSVVAWRAGNNRPAGVFLLLATIVSCVASFSDLPTELRAAKGFHPLSTPAGVLSTGGVDRLCPALPLVVDNALRFMEADNRLPADVAPRMVYLTDPAESLRFEHENVTESVGPMSRVFGRPHHVLPGQPFLQDHPQFVLVTWPRHPGWVSDEMQERHAQTQSLGRYTFAGDIADVWLVSQASSVVSASGVSASSGCSSQEQQDSSR